MAFVLDASVTLAWCFVDERTPYTRSMLRELEHTEAVAPAVWPLEVGNGLLIGERRQRLSEQQVARLVRMLSDLPITIDASNASVGIAEMLVLARDHKLSTYDASYLHLATRLGLPLATKDRRLGAAARSAGVSIARPSH